MKKISLIFLSLVFIAISFGKVSAQDVKNSRGVVQVYDVESVSDLPENKIDQYYYEDDSVLISFLFWSSKGKLMMRIENKLTKPIYINWSESKYLVEGTSIPLTPYTDKLSDEKLELYSKYKAVEPTLTDMDYEWKRELNKEENEEEDQIISIQPHSTYSKGNYYLIGSQGIVMDTSASFDVTKSRGKRGLFRKKHTETHVYHQEFSKEESPVNFGVSIVYSTDSTVNKDVQKIEEHFYVSAVHEMEAIHFRGKKTGRDAEGFSIYKFPERSSTRFYVEIDRRNSVDFNKRM
ncbi:MAG: hypothetical protein R6U95_10900 [Bacteroidales bacterium]